MRARRGPRLRRHELDARRLRGPRGRVPVAHVEAGLRSGDLEMPEERNRIEVDALSTYLFAPDERSAATLREEGVAGEIHVVGDVMADASARFAPARARALQDPRAGSGSSRAATCSRRCTARRTCGPSACAGSWRASAALALPVVFPAHPRTSERARAAGHRAAADDAVIEPLGYLDFAALASQAA